MDVRDIIDKKTKRLALSEKEIEFVVLNFTNGNIPDYQMSAFLMAIYLNGMNKLETFYLTKSMWNSGQTLNFSDLGTIVDKHSTGGVSDTTTIVIAPIIACCGVKMLKLSGRSLGFTGGTIDKLESFYGYNINLSMEKAKELIIKNGACVIGSNISLAPADKKIYALRDVTATVGDISLIASSIMSKKLASGADVIVLDVKFGNGAFIKKKSEARKLADIMCDIGRFAGKKMFAFVSDMNEPLGYNIGNMLESYEAIEVLKGKKGKLFNESVKIATKCVELGLNISAVEAKKKVLKSITSGDALNKLKDMILDQGGSLELFEGLHIKPILTIRAKNHGKVIGFKTKRLGEIVGQMGASRKKISDVINYEVGIKTYQKSGDKFKPNDRILSIYCKNLEVAKSVQRELLDCIIVKEYVKKNKFK